jgi:predicted nucleic acid-binding protein
MNLTEIRPDELIVIDTNILVYATQQRSRECEQLLARCARGEVRGVVPISVVAELMHRLMVLEARENGWIVRANPSRALSEKPESVRRLTNYAKQMHEFLGIGLRLEPVTRVDLIESMSVQREFGLLTNDSLLVAVARRINCESIASADKGFAGLRGLTVYEPSDIKDQAT